MSRSPDDDRTLGPVTDGSGASDFGVSSSMSVHTLPEGTRIRDYQITGLIGEGGFGIVYLAFDVSLQRRVAIKEYLPSSMASRANASMAVVVKSPRHVETFALGLKSFVNEARLLARFDHPSLVKVYRFWEENGTAYMVMPYYEGPTLKRALAELGRVPDEAELRGWLRPLLDALAVMHAAHCFHRDIAPDNILLTPRGPLLLDFGAARRVIGDMTHALTVVLKPGFAPIEQYGESSVMTQGAWTDLYALASVVYAAVTGHAPVSSVERLMDDRLRPLGELAAGRYSEPFLSAIDAALALRPKDRPQTVAAFRALLDGRDTESAPSIGFASTFGAPLDSVLPDSTLPPPLVPLPPAVPRSAAAIDIALGAPPAVATPLPRPRRTMVYALVGSASLLGLAAAGYYFGGDRGAKPDAEHAPAASEAMPAAPTARPAPAPPPRAVSTPAPPPPAAAPAPVIALPPAPVPAPKVLPKPAPSPVAEPAPAPVLKAEPAAAPTAAPATIKAEPATAPAAGTAASKPKREPRLVEPRLAEPRPPAAEPAERPAPTNTAVTKARCSDILQKASLEPLTASEADFLKKECR